LHSFLDRFNDVTGQSSIKRKKHHLFINTKAIKHPLSISQGSSCHHFRWKHFLDDTQRCQLTVMAAKSLRLYLTRNNMFIPLYLKIKTALNNSIILFHWSDGSGSKIFDLGQVRSDKPSMVWVWIWKISPKNVKFFNLFPSGLWVKKIS